METYRLIQTQAQYRQKTNNKVRTNPELISCFKNYIIHRKTYNLLVLFALLLSVRSRQRDKNCANLALQAT